MRVVRRLEKRLSRWVTLVEKDVVLTPGGSSQTYHAFKQADYVGVLAVLPDDRIALIRQYRPAIESYTWEFPAGLLEPGEDPEDCCRRELREEVGLEARRVLRLGTHPAEVGRLENAHHMFYVEAASPRPDFVPEAGTSVEFISPAELDQYILSGRFAHPLHLALLLMYRLRFPLGRPGQEE